MIGVEVEARRTPWTRRGLLHAYVAAFRTVTGLEPSRRTLAIAFGQSTLECGHDGAGCRGFNVSNIMGVDPETGCFHVLHKAPECAVDPHTIPGATPLTSSHVVCAPGQSAYLPAGGSRFRSYPNVEAGCRDKLRVVAELWPEAFLALVAGDVRGYVVGLWNGVDGRDYATADKGKYLSDVSWLADDLFASATAFEWPQITTPPRIDPGTGANDWRANNDPSAFLDAIVIGPEKS